MDITPLIPKGRQIIESYGGGAFGVSGVSYAQAVLVLPDQVIPLSITSLNEITPDTLAPLAEHHVELLLVGGGTKFSPLNASLSASLKESGVACESMDTGAACRTYNILMAEERKVAALLLPV